MRRPGLLLALLGLSGLLQAQQWERLEARDQPVTVAASGIVASADSLRFGPPPNRRWRIAIT
ncbi:MAG: hypothetical protein V2I48_12330, partial [Xanthomonadales bacterium]|nr:hypothetical protein [Xanthomonadales bacterium]